MKKVWLTLNNVKKEKKETRNQWEKEKILGCPKSSFWFFCNILQKDPNELLGQPDS